MKNWCRYRDGYLHVGSRTDSRDTFFCSAKRKYPKKRRPGCRLPPALLAFERGRRASCPYGNAPHPCGAPTGCSLGTSMYLALRVLRMQIGYPADLSVQKLRCSAQHTGDKRSTLNARTFTSSTRKLKRAFTKHCEATSTCGSPIWNLLGQPSNYGTSLIPYAAPSTVAFIEISPKGCGRDAARRRRGWEAPSADPR